MARRWRLINDGPGDPAWNMAVDEALALLHHVEGIPTLRLYTWAPPALSLGYFQKTDGIRFDELERLGIIPVRRITGGRAVLHYRDLTYSITLSASGEIPANVSASYRYLSGGLLAAFDALGIAAAPGSERSGRDAPGACFALSTGADIVFRGKKFVGSAQKRIGSTLLQHGAILVSPQTEILGRIFENSQAGSAGTLTGKVTCIEDIMKRPVSQEEIVDAVVEGFVRALGIEFLPGCLMDDETRAAQDLLNKYRWGSREGKAVNE